MRTLATILFAMLLVSPAWAYERPDAFSLCGEWEFVPCEPLIDIVEDRYARPDFPTLSPLWDEVIDPAGRPPDDAEWMTVSVPNAWEHYMGASYNEAGWYARYVEIEPEWVQYNRRIWIEFDAVATAAGVWADGEFVGAHVGDYSRWRVELTEVVQAKYARAQASGKGMDVVSPYTLLLWVYVDELPFHITQGFLSMIAPHHGGIWQDVRLYSTGALSIKPDGLEINATEVEMDEHFNCEYRCSLEVDRDEDWRLGKLYAEVLIEMPKEYSPGGYMSSEYFTEMFMYLNYPDTLDFQVSFDGLEWLFPWSPDKPAVYEMTVTLLEEIDGTDKRLTHDSVAQTFAMRDIRMEDGKVLLNDEPIRIRSALNWGYYPMTYGPTPSPEVVRDEFEYIKSLGFNAETVCLINMPDYFYDIADEMGVLIWQEYPTWHNTFAAEHKPTYDREFPAYLLRDRNHPSIIMRSISVEAGVSDWDVLGRIHYFCTVMTGEPVQDNNSWFSHSRPEYTDWNGEDNYFNCAQWATHLYERLPGQLAEYPTKPYIIGESILSNTWVDVDSMQEQLSELGQLASESYGQFDLMNFYGNNSELAPYLGGQGSYPWWFPSCFNSCAEINGELRARYNMGLGDGRDIINDWFLPMSEDYALNFRRFQIEVMHASEQYGGYTVNVVRDMPLIRAGLIDSTGQQRWTPEQWAWHNDDTQAKLSVSQWKEMSNMGENPLEALSLWQEEWDAEIDVSTPLLAMNGGYSELAPLLAEWDEVKFVDSSQLSPVNDQTRDPLSSNVLVTSVLTHEAVWHLQNGNAVILLTSKWPGGLGSFHHYFWRDAVFVPPVGPWGEADCHRIINLQPFDLNMNTTQVIPVDDLGITDSVDPLVRLYDTHDLSKVVTYDQVFATNVSDGLLIASSLDHSTNAGQWALSKLAVFAAKHCDPANKLFDLQDTEGPAGPDLDKFPRTSIELDKLRELAVTRANGIMGLDEGWSFKLDPDQLGEGEGWMQPSYDTSAWDIARAGVGWESLGYSYDGMGWYIREIDAPADWEGGKVRLVAEGIDDAYVVWVNGNRVEQHGSFTAHEETVWLKQTVTDLTGHLIPGQRTTLALQVVDITGQGGIWRPIYLAVD